MGISYRKYFLKNRVPILCLAPNKIFFSLLVVLSIDKSFGILELRMDQQVECLNKIINEAVTEATYTVRSQTFIRYQNW